MVQVVDRVLDGQPVKMSTRRSPAKDYRKGAKDKKIAAKDGEKQDKSIPDKKGKLKEKPIVVSDPQSLHSTQLTDDGVPHTMLGNVHPSVNAVHHGGVHTGGHRGVQRAPSAMTLHDTVVLTSDTFEMLPTAEELSDPSFGGNGSSGAGGNPSSSSGEQNGQKKDLVMVAKMMQTTTRHDNAKVTYSFSVVVLKRFFG